jgi:hypothetical protein
MERRQKLRPVGREFARNAGLPQGQLAAVRDCGISRKPLDFLNVS